MSARSPPPARRLRPTSRARCDCTPPADSKTRPRYTRSCWPGRPRAMRGLCHQLGVVRLQQDRLDEAADSAPARRSRRPLRRRAARVARRSASPARIRCSSAIAAFRAALAAQRRFRAGAVQSRPGGSRARQPRDARQAWQRFSAPAPGGCPRLSRARPARATAIEMTPEAARWFSRQAERMPDDADGCAYLTGVSLDRLARLPEAIGWLGRRRTARRCAPTSATRWASPASISARRRRRSRTHAPLCPLDPGHAETHEQPPDGDPPRRQRPTRNRCSPSTSRGPRATPAPKTFRAPHFPTTATRTGGCGSANVSPRFCGGPLAHFLLPLLESPRPGPRARHVLRDLRDRIRRGDGAPCVPRRRRVARRGRQRRLRTGRTGSARDGIDVLVDLAGHCPGNRLGVFARRGAPVQFTWMDYVGTTALPSMDYVVTDALHTPVRRSAALHGTGAPPARHAAVMSARYRRCRRFRHRRRRFSRERRGAFEPERRTGHAQQDLGPGRDGVGPELVQPVEDSQK